MSSLENLSINRVLLTLIHYLVGIPGLFESLTREQNAVAQEKLSAKADPKAHNPRVFDYDIAVLL